MRGEWVASATRARGLCTRRLGAGSATALAAAPDLATALRAVAASLDPSVTTPVTDRPTAERALGASLLWRLRVLAGWLPPGGTVLLRALAAPYERDNIVRLANGKDADDDWQLGGLASAWPQLSRATSLDELRLELARSVWGRVEARDVGPLRDELTASWLRRLAVTAPLTRPWAVAASTLLAARLMLVDGTEPTARLRDLLRPFLGEGWERATELDQLRDALPRSAAEPLRGLGDVRELWKAEARLAARIESDCRAALLATRPGPDVVTAAAALLAVDTWRARVALSTVGRSGHEVLDVVA